MTNHKVMKMKPHLRRRPERSMINDLGSNLFTTQTGFSQSQINSESNYFWPTSESTKHHILQFVEPNIAC